jgi:DNA-binding GntR family transcriptional regulator
MFTKDLMIESIPKWGVRISEDTPERVKDRYFIRKVLETAAVKRLRENFQDDYNGKLVDAAEKCDAMKRTSSETYRKFAEAHNEFHA